MNSEPAAAEPTPLAASQHDPADPAGSPLSRAESERSGFEQPQPEQSEPRQLEAQPAQSTVETAVSIRKVPKYTRFLILGAGFGAIGTFILTASFPSDPAIGFGPLFGYFLIYGVPIGVVIGALAAITLDLIWRRRARTGIAAQTIVDALPYNNEAVTADEDPAQNPGADVSALPTAEAPGDGAHRP